MKFISLDDNFKKRPQATFYSGKNYTGESQELVTGLYNLRQLTIGMPQSIRLGKQATCMIVEKLDGSGPRTVISEDVPDLSAMSVTPVFFALAGNIAGYDKDGRLTATLNAGGYSVSVLKENNVVRLEVPEGLVVRFSRGTSVEEAKTFKEGDVAIDATLLDYSNLDVILMWDQSELSETELAMVAGGKGICGGKVCGADVGGICAAQVCGAAVVPGIPVSP